VFIATGGLLAARYRFAHRDLIIAVVRAGSADLWVPEISAHGAELRV
jgi:hypothetical protein